MQSTDACAAGVDIGGSGVRAGLVDRKGQLIGEPIRLSHDGRPIRELVNAALKPLCASDIPTGIAIPGSVGGDGKISASPTLPALVGTYPEQLISSDTAPTVMNDADAALLGEIVSGAARSYRRPLGLFLGTGVGGAFAQDGQLLRGSELGHLRIRDRGRVCGCGRRGCLEAYASGSAVQRRYGRMTGMLLDGADIADRARNGDRDAMRAFTAQGHALGDALSDLVEIFAPDVIVLGGRASFASDVFNASMFSRMSDRARPGAGEVPIRRAELGNWSGVVGAAHGARRLNTT